MDAVIPRIGAGVGKDPSYQLERTNRTYAHCAVPLFSASALRHFFKSFGYTSCFYLNVFGYSGDCTGKLLDPGRSGSSGGRTLYFEVL